MSEKIEQGNRLIAEFDKLPVIDVYVQNERRFVKHWNIPQEKIRSFGFQWLCVGRDEKFMKYHAYWDWLMPVVEKIEKLGYDSRIHGNNSDGGFLCDFVRDGITEIYLSTNYKSKITAVYEAVIGFIKWFNSEQEAHGSVASKAKSGNKKPANKEKK